MSNPTLLKVSGPEKFCNLFVAGYDDIHKILYPEQRYLSASELDQSALVKTQNEEKIRRLAGAALRRNDLEKLRSFSGKKFLAHTIIAGAMITVVIALPIIFSYLICTSQKVSIKECVLVSLGISFVFETLVAPVIVYNVLHASSRLLGLDLFDWSRLSFVKVLFGTIFGGPSPFGRQSNKDRLEQEINDQKSAVSKLVKDTDPIYHLAKTALEDRSSELSGDELFKVNEFVQDYLFLKNHETNTFDYEVLIDVKSECSFVPSTLGR